MEVMSRPVVQKFETSQLHLTFSLLEWLLGFECLSGSGVWVLAVFFASALGFAASSASLASLSEHLDHAIALNGIQRALMDPYALSRAL
jgi:hypothetical protein